MQKLLNQYLLCRTNTREVQLGIKERILKDFKVLDPFKFHSNNKTNKQKQRKIYLYTHKEFFGNFGAFLLAKQ
jgi:hypothetical protein